MAEIGEDTFVRSPGGYAANVEAVRSPSPPPVPYDDAARPRTSRTPRTPRPSRPWSRWPTRAFPRATGRGTAGRHAEERRRAWSSSRTARASRWSSACPVTGRWTSSGWRRRSSRPRSSRSPRTTSPRTPRWSRATSVRRCWAPTGRPGSATWSTRGWSPGTRWVTGANEPGRHVFDLVAGRDFTSDGVIEAAEVRDGDPAPGRLRVRCELARGIEMGHIFQLGRKYAEALGLQGAGRERQARHGHHGLLRRRGLPRRRRGRRGRPATRRDCAGRGSSRRPTCSSWPPARTTAMLRPRPTDLAARAGRRRGHACCCDDRKASPGVKFADAEILGMPTIVVVGRGLAEGVVEVRDRRERRARGRAGRRRAGRDRRRSVHSSPTWLSLTDLGELPALTLALLVLAAFVAGWVDAVVGGGGLIQLPALLIAVAGHAPRRPRSSAPTRSVLGLGDRD